MTIIKASMRVETGSWSLYQLYDTQTEWMRSLPTLATEHQLKTDHYRWYLFSEAEMLVF
jgi:predicted kinase